MWKRFMSKNLNIFSFPSILLRAISVLMRILLFLLRKICYVHNATHQHLACDEKHDDFIIFSAVFFKETLYILMAIFIRYFFYFSPLLLRSWTHYSSIIITTSFISEKFVIKSKYTFGFHWRAISFNLIQCFLIAHHPLTLSWCV